MRKWLLLFVLTTLLFLSLYLYEKYSAPVSLLNCDKGYSDCNLVAKFKERWSCEQALEKRGWACKTEDKNNITCVEEDSKIAEEYCK